MWPEEYRGRLGFLTVTALFAVTYSVLRFTYNVDNPQATFQALLEFGGDIPFALRILVPSLARPFVELDLPVRPAFFGYTAMSA